MHNESDETLLDKINNGDKNAFTMLVQRHATRFFRVSYRIVLHKEDAEDIVQEAFIKLWTKPYMWDPSKRTKFTTWFYRIIINHSLNIKKTKANHSSIEIHKDYLKDETASAEDILTNRMKVEFMEEHIKQLPHNQQIALSLCFFDELSNKEAADIMNISLKALQSLISRAKTSLKKKTGKYYEGNI